MSEIIADPTKGLDAAIAAVPELGQDRATQEAILDATIAVWQPPGSTGAAGLGDDRPRRLAGVDRLHDGARARPEPGHGRRGGVGGVPSGALTPRLSSAHAQPRPPGSAAVRASAPGSLSPLARRRNAPRARRCRRPSTRPAGSGTWARPRRRAAGRASAAAVDLRPTVLMPGLVDTHAHLPQLPNAGLGFALDLLTWLDRLTFPTERSWSDPAVAERLAPAIFRAFAAAGTTTVLAYGVVYEAAMDVAFRAAEAHGIRAILGKVMMDRITYDPTIEPSTILDRSLRESAALIERWHGAADGRLGYAVTPRFAVSCTAELLRESAALAQVDRDVVAEPRVGGPRRDRGGRRGCSRRPSTTSTCTTGRAPSGERSVLAHAIHLSDAGAGADRRDRARACRTARRRTCSSGPGSCRCRAGSKAGVAVGLGSDVSGGPDPSIFGVMRAGALSQMGLRVLGHETRPPLAPLDWLRLGTHRRGAGARARRRDRLARGRQGGRPDRRGPGDDVAAARRSGRGRGAARRTAGRSSAG